MKQSKVALSVAFCSFAISGIVNATSFGPDCLHGSETNAVSVHTDPADINFSCSRLQTPDGTTMVNLADDGKAVVIPGQSDGASQISWEEVRIDTNEDGIPDQRYRVYWVHTSLRRINGFPLTRGHCNYTYDGSASGGQGLGASNLVIKGDVELCGDPNPVAIATEIISTERNACIGTIEFSDAADQGAVESEEDLTFAYSAAGPTKPETVAVCAGGGNADPLLGQVECIGPDKYVQQEPSGDCEPNQSGELPLSCAPVDIEAATGGLEYCWYYQNRVCEAGSSLTYCDPDSRTAGTYIPQTLVNAFDASVDVTTGSRCYTTYLRGRAYFYCP
jgi:hypothetical protein